MVGCCNDAALLPSPSTAMSRSDRGTFLRVDDDLSSRARSRRLPSCVSLSLTPIVSGRERIFRQDRGRLDQAWADIPV